jgi:hypothetical protein
MAQYPVEDDAGLFEAVNYLLSGPAGLGQNFNGFSSYQPVYLTGTFRAPFVVSTTTNPPSWYVAPISINNIVRQNVVNGETANLEWTFTTPQATPPFRVGQRVDIANVTPDDYDAYGYLVLTCSTTTFQTQDSTVYPYPAYVSGGDVSLDNTDSLNSTDANARVTVQGPTEIVFISSQLALTSGYTCTTSSSFSVTVQVNRYRGFVDTKNPGAVDYLFNYDETVSEQLQIFTVGTGTGTVNCGQNIFTTVLDQPSFGYYWYICEVLFVTKPTYRYDGQGQLVTGLLYGDGLSVSGTSSNTTATYTANVVNISSSGVGGQLSVDTNGITDYVATTITVTNSGSGYAVGDTVKLLGTDLGGSSPANDMLITLTQIAYPGDAYPTQQSAGLRSLTAQVIKQ